MAGPPFTPPTDPADCFGLSPFGFGPFPEPGQSVVFCPPHPDGSGYGGVGWAPNTIVTEPGGGPYGLGAYGSAAFGAPPMNVNGGYGGDPYGLGPYGSTERTPPRMTSAVSLNGWEIEVFFSEKMNPDDPALLDPASYILTPVVGGLSTVTAVRVERLGSVNAYTGDFFAGVLSVILTHTGTLLGGTYSIRAQGPTDIAGNPLLDIEVSLLTRGEAPPYSILPTSGEEILFLFAQDMLPAASEPVGNVHGILDAASYEFTSTPEYPVVLTPTLIEHPVGGDAKQVRMTVRGMTSLNYRCRITPATAIDYDGSYLPSEATEFSGVELYPANGTSIVLGGHLLLARPSQKAYGWTFADISGRVVPDTSNFRVDLSFDAGSAAYNPPLGAYTSIEIGQWVVEDGPAASGVQVKITLQRAVGPVDQIRVQSGTFDQTFDVPWSVPGAITLSVIRNRKAGLYVVLLNERPIIATAVANFNQPAQGAGANATWTFFGCLPDISGFQIRGVRYTATQTVFSGAWNFLHDWDALFVGSDLLTKDWLETQRGPLVKNWGDATPATKQDVHVFVNGGEVEIEEVNPYTGKVTLAIPVPLLPPDDPQASVLVDYHWMASPIMAIEGLNTEGLVLNKWDRDVGRHATTPEENKTLGAADIARFPMAVVLGPVQREEPLLVGHRYMGFERGYSALLNSPTTMLLNQNPYRAEKPAFETDPEGTTGAYVGTTTPEDAATPWAANGPGGSGQVNIGRGTYTITKDARGTFFYSREVDLRQPSSVVVAARFLIESVTPSGVFTGVCFGFEDNNGAYVAGALQVNGLEHVGLLKDSRAFNDAAGWEIGPKAPVSIQTPVMLAVPTSRVPQDFTTGGRFQILSGSQAGVYTAGPVIRHSTGSTEITLTSGQTFPADPRLYGNRDADVVFEARWSEGAITDLYTTYRLVADTSTKVVQLWASGETTALAAELDGDVPPPGFAAVFGLVVESPGLAFWGVLDEEAVSVSRWVLARYGTMPLNAVNRGFSRTVLAEMDRVPEDDLNYEWFPRANYGHSYTEVGVLGHEVVLKRTSCPVFTNTPFAYERIEPFFSPEANFDLQGKFRVDSGFAVMVLNDGVREARLMTLLYDTALGGQHSLVWPPAKTFSGAYTVASQRWGWFIHQATMATVGLDLVLTVTPEDDGSVPISGAQVNTEIDLSAYSAADDNGRILEVRLAVDSYEAAPDETTGIYFGGDVNPDRYIAVRLRGGATPGVQLIDQSGFAHQVYDFDWDDGEFHDYRLVASNGAASLFIDGVLQLPTVSLGAFTGDPGWSRFHFGANLWQSVTRWRAASYAVLPPQIIQRTLGVLVGTDPLDIDSWELPRTDSETVPNSDPLAVIKEMDWRDPSEVRMLRTPDWGLTVYRPDMSLPPYYTPETPGVPGTGFATQTTEPSAGWINVEYNRLPRVPAKFGSVIFGADDPNSDIFGVMFANRAKIPTQQHWDYVRYRLFLYPTEDHRQPEHMVLNYGNVITSGEWSADVSLETARLTPYTVTFREKWERTGSTRYCLDLKSLHIYARDIYKVVDDLALYTSDSWTFDSDTQVIRFDRDIILSGAEVEVLFYAGKPVTNTYLLSQPLLDSPTLLNEGTPPVPKSQMGEARQKVVPGSELNDPLNPNPMLNDSYKALTFEDVPGTLYESLSFMQVTNGGARGLIAIAGERMLPTGFSGFEQNVGEDIYSPNGAGEPLGGTGASAGLKKTGQKVGAPAGTGMEFKGSLFWEKVGSPKPDAFEQGGGMPGHTLFASGGNYLGPMTDPTGKVTGIVPLGGVLGPGTAVLYPNFPSQNARPGRGEGAIYRRTDWFLRLSSVLRGEEEIPLRETWVAPSDEEPPTRPANWQVSPSGPPWQNGSCFAVMTCSGEFSHIGPWGGISSLIPTPDSGFFEFRQPVVDNDRVVVEVVKPPLPGLQAIFTARNVPVGINEFPVGPNPHIGLALAINRVFGTLDIEASAGLLWTGVQATLVEAVHPISTTFTVNLISAVPAIVVTGTVGGLLTGGAGILQSSLLAGGYATVPDPLGLHIPERGMVCQGGAPLPPGSEVAQVLRAGTG